MNEPLTWLLLFGIGIVSGFLNVMAGGGSTLTLPLLIFMGLESSLANGTNRVAILIQNIAAVLSFKNENKHAFKQSLSLSLWALPGAIIGALIAVNINDELFQRILGIVLIIIIISMFYSPKEISHASLSPSRRWMLFLALFGTGLYGGFLQVGVGFLFMAVLQRLGKMDLVTVNMHKVFIVNLYTVPALALFLFTDNIEWSVGLVLGAGSAIGGWTAAKVSVKGGEKVIRILLVVAMAVMAAKLFEVF